MRTRSVYSSLAVIVAAVFSASMARAQQTNARWWALSLYAGGASGATRGVARGLMTASDMVGASVRVKLGRRPWWVGLDLDAMHGNPTAAGLDTIVAHSQRPDLVPENGGAYTLDVASMSIRGDVVTSRFVTIYGLGTGGLARTLGYIDSGGCTVSGCEEPEVYVTFPDRRLAVSLGGGILVRIPNLIPGIDLRSMKLLLEARGAAISTAHGRLLAAPTLFGITW